MTRAAEQTPLVRKKWVQIALSSAVALAALVGGAGWWWSRAGPLFVFGQHTLVAPYGLFKTNGNTIVLMPLPPLDRQRFKHAPALTARVDSVGVSGPWIYGHVRPSPQSEVETQTPGYFLLDTVQHEYRMSGEPDEAKWTAMLDQLVGPSRPAVRSVR